MTNPGLNLFQKSRKKQFARIVFKNNTVGSSIFGISKTVMKLPFAKDYSTLNWNNKTEPWGGTTPSVAGF